MRIRRIGSVSVASSSTRPSAAGSAERPGAHEPAGASAAAQGPRAPVSTWTSFKRLLRHSIAFLVPPLASRAHVVPDPGFGDRMLAALKARDLTALKGLIERLPRRGSERDRIAWVVDLLGQAADYPPADCAEITVTVLRQAARLPPAARDAVFETLLSLAQRSRESGDFYQTSYWLRSAEELVDSLSPERQVTAVAACQSQRLAWNERTEDGTLVNLASQIGSSPPDQTGDKVHALLLATQGRAVATRTAVLESLAAKAPQLSARALRQVAVAAFEQLERPADLLNGLLDRVESLAQGP